MLKAQTRQPLKRANSKRNNRRNNRRNSIPQQCWGLQKKKKKKKKKKQSCGGLGTGGLRHPAKNFRPCGAKKKKKKKKILFENRFHGLAPEATIRRRYAANGNGNGNNSTGDIYVAPTNRNGKEKEEETASPSNAGGFNSNNNGKRKRNNNGLPADGFYSWPRFAWTMPPGGEGGR
jgi:hypothetical protein